MKNKPKKSSNKYGLLLLALLLIGVASYGTYAYFTDSSTVASDINLQTGTVKFDEVSKNINWQYVPLQKTDNSIIDDKTANNTDKKLDTNVGTSYTNVRPGDYFEKTIKVAYSGSLDAKLTATINDAAVAAVNKANYEVTVKATPSSENPKVYNVSLKVGVPLNNNGEKFAAESSRNNSAGVSLAAIENAVTITAVQSNVTTPATK